MNLCLNLNMPRPAAAGERGDDPLWWRHPTDADAAAPYRPWPPPALLMGGGTATGGNIDGTRQQDPEAARTARRGRWEQFRPFSPKFPFLEWSPEINTAPKHVLQRCASRFSRKNLCRPNTTPLSSYHQWRMSWEEGAAYFLSLVQSIPRF